MADTIEFELVSPEKLMMSAPVEMVVIPGAEGDFGVLPGHAPMISTLRTGVISIWNGGTVEAAIFVAGGFAEVNPERCTVLAEEVVPPIDADAGAVTKRISGAHEELENAHDDAARDAAQKNIEVAEALGDAIRAAAG